MHTAVVLAHHITRKEEWTWYATDSGGEHCGADDHAKDVCGKIRAELANAGYPAEVVKYPEESGLQFRFVAQAAGLGKIGVNAHLFHPAWGPWVHLRVLATAAQLEIRPRTTGDQFCSGCMLCITECPAKAISAETFSGNACRAYRKNRGEYVPYGEKKEYRYCLRCLLICPRGKRPDGF
jgi:epoxyqueuosine reductase QueG